jgi:hypothetical protein
MNCSATKLHEDGSSGSMSKPTSAGSKKSVIYISQAKAAIGKSLAVVELSHVEPQRS